MKALRLLLLEDSPLDAELTLAKLAEEEIPCNAVRVDNRLDFVAQLDGNCPDLILADYSLPSFDGISALEIAQETCPAIPFIFVSGALGEELAIETLKRGATDYVLKHRLERLAPSVQRALREAAERSARKRLEAELRCQVEALAEADRRKDQFLAMLAHELRNPLAPIRHAVEILKRWETNEPRVARAREIIDRQVTHQARLLDDLLDVSRIARGKISLRHERVDLVRLVRDTIEDCRGLLDAARLRLSVELPEEPVWVEGDPTRLAQVIGNLLNNAVKFTDRGGEVTVGLRIAASESTRRHGDTEHTEAGGQRACRQPFPSVRNSVPSVPPCLRVDSESLRVTSDAGPQPQSAILTIRDTGIGIEPEMLPHIFETFAQADRSLDRSRGGLGLGLALVKGLVERHGGTVEARSEGLGRGAAFIVRLPTIDTRGASPRPSPAGPGRVGSSPHRILVVEDNRDAAETLRDLLELSGFTVEVAHAGTEAVAAARAFRPEAVLCDLGLPGMNGYQVAAALRQDPATAGARLIAVSGYGQEEDQRRSREAGFDLHLTKPVDFPELERLLTEPLAR